MIKLKQLDKLQEDYLTKLTVPELKNYIINLSIEYFISMASHDHKKVKLIVETFEKLKDLHEEKNVEEFINYCLIDVFNKTVVKSNFLINIEEPILVIGSNNGNNILVESELEKAVEYFKFKEIHRRTEELVEANLSEEEIRELFNFHDYYIGNPEELKGAKEHE